MEVTAHDYAQTLCMVIPQWIWHTFYNLWESQDLGLMSVFGSLCHHIVLKFENPPWTMQMWITVMLCWFCVSWTRFNITIFILIGKLWETLLTPNGCDTLGLITSVLCGNIIEYRMDNAWLCFTDLSTIGVLFTSCISNLCVVLIVIYIGQKYMNQFWNI